MKYFEKKMIEERKGTEEEKERDTKRIKIENQGEAVVVGVEDGVKKVVDGMVDIIEERWIKTAAVTKLRPFFRSKFENLNETEKSEWTGRMNDEFVRVLRSTKEAHLKEFLEQRPMWKAENMEAMEKKEAATTKNNDNE